MALFKKNKNKIKNSINKAGEEETISKEIDSEFELLTKVKRKQKEKNFFHILFVQPFISLKVNTVEKYHATLNYLKQNYDKVLAFFILILLLTTLAIGLWIVFSPFPITVSGSVQIAISNFYLGTNGSISGITGIGIAFIVLLIALLGLGLFYIIKLKREKFIIKTSLTTKILSIICYVLLVAAFIFLLVLVVFPPSVISSANQQDINNLIVQINNASTDAQKLQLIQKLAQITQDPKYNVTPLTNVSIAGYNDWIRNSGYFYNLNNALNNLIYHADIGSTIYTLSTNGIIIIVFITLLFALSLIIIPFVIYCIVSLHQFKNSSEDEIMENWNPFRVWFFSMITKIKNIFAKTKEKHENKDSFHKYKKRSKNKGILTKETKTEFTTEVDKSSAIKQSLTMKEIESNPANIAFLSKDGKWMYHDGKGKVFEAKGDEWIPYDVDKEIHKAHANIVDESLNFSPSHKKAKEDKMGFIKNKKESAIALPDEEIDNIVKDLNI